MWNCKHCNKKFDYQTISEKANHSRWCSKNPNRKETTKKFSTMNDTKWGIKKEFNVICNSCKKQFTVTERETLFPSKEKYFCSRNCANSTGGKAKALKYHADAVAKYTVVAWRYHEKKCVVCGEDKVVAVHHFNENHNDNNPKNLVPLCPTHHLYMHSKFKYLINDKVIEYINNWGL